MTQKNKPVSLDARKQKRIPLLKNIAEPVNIRIPSLNGSAQPAVMVDLSSGGMSFILFSSVPVKVHVVMILDLPGLKGAKVEGHVVRVEEKGDTAKVAIAFSAIKPETAHRIDQMAHDHNSCESRIALVAEKICYASCHYWDLCGKPQKGKT